MPTVALIEEVPGVPENERWFIWERADPGMFARGKLWHGATRADGEAWAAANGETLNEVERFDY